MLSLPHPLLADDAVQANFEAVARAMPSGFAILTGMGDPNGTFTASPGALYLNRAGGASTTLWVKESGVNTDTGWVGK